MEYLNGVSARLADIAGRNRLRSIRARGPDVVADFSTNDYLGLARDPAVVAALHQARQAGATGARLLSGSHPAHVELEEKLAAWLAREAALIFSSGYLAALGVIPVLSTFVDVAYSDALNHACLIDGLRLSGIERRIYPHLQLPSRRERSRRALIVTESLFGMNGDVANVAEIVADLNDGDIVLVDEAHALGVAGEAGAGMAAGLQDNRLVILGTLSKSLGASGGFIAGPAALIALLINTARSFIFDTALPPALASAATTAATLAAQADGRRATLHARVARLVTALGGSGIETSAVYPSPVVPVLARSEEAALKLSAKCAAAGFIAPAIRPPSVPPGSSRLRLSLSALHTDAQIDEFVRTLTA